MTAVTVNHTARAWLRGRPASGAPGESSALLPIPLHMSPPSAFAHDMSVPATVAATDLMTTTVHGRGRGCLSARRRTLCAGEHTTARRRSGDSAGRAGQSGGVDHDEPSPPELDDARLREILHDPVHGRTCRSGHRGDLLLCHRHRTTVENGVQIQEPGEAPGCAPRNTGPRSGVLTAAAPARRGTPRAAGQRSDKCGAADRSRSVAARASAPVRSPAPRLSASSPSQAAIVRRTPHPARSRSASRCLRRVSSPGSPPGHA